MTQTTPLSADRLPLKTKVAFGVGSSAEIIALYAVSSFALVFYNQVLGVPPHWVGIAISVSLIFDGLTEPLIGSWSDRTRSKLGRRHPWMYAAPIPITLTFFAIFNPPQGLDLMGLAMWCGVTTSLLRQVMTFFHTPHLALGAELSPNYIERSKVMAYNSFFTWAGGASMTWIALTYFFPSTPTYPRGLLNPEPWPAFALTMATIILVVLFASAWFTRDRIPFLPQPGVDVKKFSMAEFFADIWKALRNRNYVWLLIGIFFLSMMIGLKEGLRLYTATFYWGLNSEQLRLFVLGSFVGYATAFIFAARMHGKFDKRATMVWGAVAYALTTAAPLVAGLLGILTPQTPNLVWMLIAWSALSYGSMSVLQIGAMSALADIADENELRFGVRQEGILYSTRALAAKIDQAIGSLLAGYVLLIIAFPEKAKPGAVGDDVLMNLALWDGVFAAVPGVIAAICYSRYRISRATFEATRAAIQARRAAGISPTEPPPVKDPPGVAAATPAT
ncbi:MAG: MFS transporter [Alphaproteobacteria bacterium]|nr:MFS transporter [Alphaproteobacteria bacterium]MBU1514941.1 MFS transporter [Alphaproteobacteria bacterium]MBU2095622.1 MFS transporter [Alphaproteobacteria bacterium]MBU2153920.1 MFS transporter [Alphaproteobacteria bacterium]MBU2309083.1 MFS transporter [Alphaproteobacteria bacterium]